MRFYNVRDEEDLTRVETLLHRGGIEYTLTPTTADAKIHQIEVAEEDVPMAEELLLQAALKR